MKIKKASEPALNLLYYLFNKFVFNSKLPRVKVKLASIGKPNIRGFMVHKGGKCVVIVIDRADSDPVRILVHEMTHVWQVHVRKLTEGEDHPPSFVRKLRQVYKKLGLRPPTKVEIS